MKNQSLSRIARRGAPLWSIVIFCGVLLCGALGDAVRAASWNNIEPLKSRREDVERSLGKPIASEASEGDALRFKVNGGTVIITFVTPKFIAAKKLAPEYEGTVLQIALQHDGASATAEALNLSKDDEFTSQTQQNVTVYTNARKGLIYTFVDGKLKTSWFNASAEQLARASRERAKR
ncbi:MAG TPA: hypothetical protein VM870_10600 [Pyrinomonadaceae bacterium]|jgi:hypothetical protein|nr:hypothetical protein [Pyrinomonadaceae bacterium]